MNLQEQLIVSGLSRMLGQKVFLTGSRFFGTASFNSDFDVFTEYSVNINSLLSTNKFEQLKKGPYSKLYADENTVTVWRRENIDIQLTRNVSHIMPK